jgi:hypothetical protein
MAVSARYSDLTVLSQHDAGEALPGAMRDLVPYVMLNAARPVLIVPPGADGAQAGGTVLVAWDGSMEATRAIGHALPLLRAARAWWCWPCCTRPPATPSRRATRAPTSPPT